MDITKTTATFTFGDCCENGTAMEKIGEMVEKGEGFNFEDLNSAKSLLEEIGIQCEIIDLKSHVRLADNEALEDVDDAYVLIARDAIDVLFRHHFEPTVDRPSNLMFEELTGLEVDKKKKNNYGKVVNSNARYNLCFVDFSQEPDYDSGKGRLINFEDVQMLKDFRELLPSYLGEKARDLFAEGNYYYNVHSGECGIGEHGDAERRKVVAVRLGQSMNLCYRWYKRFQRVSEKIEMVLNHGDVYVMSEKAVGTDWKSSSIYTLRHSAGAKKFTDPKKKES